ncbi:ReoY family proteolytic degradation factor [Tuberibacillus sp. Marseille-P3662]|uniref:ReoY family proteolytic degradation factor n=1 Tax=Tuberibacillus sp. Marseille-P3662 TaxID=1965358 RepID=UPI001594D9FE|nr:ReoY family proteolytic degradation factor [Tuberibacillus sp. Marseille-P3662]
MEQVISADQKRSFLKWFLSHYQLKNRECVWLLNYMASDEQLLNLMKFVEDVSDCPRAMVITDTNMDKQPFLYKKQQIETTQPEKAFHDIRMDQDAPIYIQLNFIAPFQSPAFVAVLEENPFYEDHRDIGNWYGEAARDVLEYAEQHFQKERLYHAIDQALDQGDSKAFHHLTRQLKDLQ